MDRGNKPMPGQNGGHGHRRIDRRGDGLERPIGGDTI
jgi:hypothetical protein